MSLSGSESDADDGFEEVRRSKRSSVKRTHEARFYAAQDDAALGEEAEGTDDYGVAYDVLEIVQSQRFKQADVLEMDPKDFDLNFVCRTGMRRPMRFRSKEGLGLTVPPPSFVIANVCELVGAQRIVDVMDVRTQEALTMTMREWTDYFNDADRDTLLNVISLEFSKTRMDPLVQSPAVVRQIDWIDTVWPPDLKAQQVETTNRTDAMKYPKVQKYCLMSVAGCFTDFHVDFGGSSVWYHILWGEKLFWLIEPTERNLKLFERWSKGNQQAIFFGDLCPDDCMLVNLHAGDTFMIPTGWIHAVYTPQDTLVFGGNFLHGFNMDGQLQIATLEQRLRVPLPYRFPFYQSLMWYAGARYVEALQPMLRNGVTPSNTLPLGQADTILAGREITSYELHGLSELVSHLSVWLASPAHRDSIPDRIGDPRGLVSELRRLLALARVMWPSFNLKVDLSADISGPSQYSFSSKAGGDFSDDVFSSAEKSDKPGGAAKKLLSEDEFAERYAQLKTVRDAILESKPTLASSDVTNAAKKDWWSLPPQTRRAFREMLKDDLLFQSAVTGEVSDKAVVLGAARKTKYEGQKWRPDVRHVQRAKTLYREPLPNILKETDEQKRARFNRAAALLMAADGHKMGSKAMLDKMATFRIKAAPAAAATTTTTTTTTITTTTTTHTSPQKPAPPPARNRSEDGRKAAPPPPGPPLHPPPPRNPRMNPYGRVEPGSEVFAGLVASDPIPSGRFRAGGAAPPPPPPPPTTQPHSLLAANPNQPPPPEPRRRGDEDRHRPDDRSGAASGRERERDRDRDLYRPRDDDRYEMPREENRYQAWDQVISAAPPPRQPLLYPPPPLPPPFAVHAGRTGPRTPPLDEEPQPKRVAVIQAPPAVTISPTVLRPVVPTALSAFNTPDVQALLSALNGVAAPPPVVAVAAAPVVEAAAAKPWLNGYAAPAPIAGTYVPAAEAIPVAGPAVGGGGSYVNHVSSYAAAAVPAPAAAVAPAAVPAPTPAPTPVAASLLSEGHRWAKADPAFS